MPAKNRYGFLLSDKGDVSKNVNDIYAQLQAPLQRKAVQDSVNNALNRTKLEQQPVGLDPLDSSRVLYVDVVVPDPYENYADVSRTANEAGIKKLISPDSLLSAYSQSPNSQTPEYSQAIKNAFINPAAEGAYDTNPLFDWKGRVVSGAGVNDVPRATATDVLMYDLRNGPGRQKKNYDDTVDNLQDAAEFQRNNAQISYEQQRYRPRATATNGFENQYTLLDRDRFGSDPDYSYRLQQSLRVDNPYASYFDPAGPNYTRTPSPTQQQFAAYQASQTRLSPSFYRGGHDNPASFPSGYRL